MMDGGVGAIFSAINACFVFAEVISKLNDVPEEARRFSSLINRVRLDYNESTRLFTHPTVTAHLSHPSQKAEYNYIHGCITSVKSALADIGRFVEKIRVQEEGILGGNGQVGFTRRCEWLWRYRSKVDSSERVLDTSHKSLLFAMQRMITWIGPAGSVVPVVTVSSAPGACAPAAAVYGAGLTSPSMVSLPPPYQEVNRSMDDQELDDGFITARRRLTKYDRREKSRSGVSINIVSAAEPMSPPATTNTINQFDAIPEMSATIHGPVEMSYNPVRSEYSRPSTASSYYAGLEPMPPFSDAARTLTPQASMSSLRSDFGRSDYGQSQSSPSTRAPSLNPRSWQLAQDPSSLRSHSDRFPYSPSEVRGRTYDERPRSAMGTTRDQRRASMRLASGGYDRLL